MIPVQTATRRFRRTEVVSEVVSIGRHSASTTWEVVRTRCRALGGGLLDVEIVSERAMRKLSELSTTPGAHDRDRVDAVCRDVVSAFLLEKLRVDPTDVSARNRLAEVWMDEVLHWSRCLIAGGKLSPEELAQEILLKVLESAPRVEKPDRFRYWLYGVTWRTIRAESRKAWVRLTVLAGKSPARDGDNASYDPARFDTHRLVRKVLERLPAETRTLLWLAHMEGLTRREICDSLGMSEGTLNRKMNQARRRFEREARTLGLDLSSRDPTSRPARRVR